MDEIPDKSIDAIICDLPYGCTDNKWDVRLPFDELWKQYLRIIKDNGAIVLFGQGKFASDLIQSNKKMLRYDLIYQKTMSTGFLNAKKMPLRIHEQILVFYKKLPTYNPQKTDGKPYYSKRQISPTKNYNCPKRETITDCSDGKRYPLSVIKFNNSTQTKKIHPTEKPIELMEWLVKTYTNEGDIVLDNCMGSGSTGVACIRNNRDFIGFESNDEYFNKAKERLKKELNNE